MLIPPFPSENLACPPSGPRLAPGGGAGAEPLLGNYFVAAYPPFSCWSDRDVRGWFEKLDAPAAPETPLGLYLHVPFCVHRCDFCYYYSRAGQAFEMDFYVDALLAELGRYAARPYFRGRLPAFVYFGGGTPSALSTRALARLLSGLKAIWPWTEADEVTFECAPQTVQASKLRLLREAGITRLSLGVQQLDDAVLAQNGRIHLTGDVEQACAAIREAGFPILNLDLIAGLVGETDDTFDRGLERVLALAPESVTVYLLEIPHNTPLFRALREGRLHEPPPGWSVKRARLGRAFQRLAAAGYRRQSAYTAVRDLSRHRFRYMRDQYRGADLLGLGASAFSYLGGLHAQNATALPEYVAALHAGRLPVQRAYALNEEERLVREFVLQLKLGALSLWDFRARFGVDVTRRFARELEDFIRAGWLELKSGRLRVTRAGLLRVDRLLTAFYLPPHRVPRYA